MVSFALRAAHASAVAVDFEVFRSALRAGLDVEQCAAVTAANATDSHSDTWMLFANRLEQGSDLYTASSTCAELPARSSLTILLICCLRQGHTIGRGLSS